MSLQSARLPRCDRWKIGVAVDRLFAHMLAAGEQEYDESDSDQRADDDDQLSVRSPVFSHSHHPPPMIFIGSTPAQEERSLHRSSMAGTAEPCGKGRPEGPCEPLRSSV